MLIRLIVVIISQITESVCCILETNIMYVDYTSNWKKKEKQNEVFLWFCLLVKTDLKNKQIFQLSWSKIASAGD